MKLHLVSDLHLEFADIELPGGDILLLSGDITVADALRSNRTDKVGLTMATRCRQFFDHVSGRYKQAYYIMGNHEHYHGQWEDTAGILIDFIKQYPNIRFLDKQGADLGDNTVLWGATLWTSMKDGNPLIVHAAKYGMNDYRLISYAVKNTSPYSTGNVPLSPLITMGEHAGTLVDLQEFLDLNKDKKVVIMTHMAPSPKSCHPRYGANDPLNWSYFSDLSELILNNTQIKVWVHGHTHDSHDYMIGDTRVICNPRGYASSRKAIPENAAFDINQFFEV